MWERERELNSLAGARVHTKQNLPLPFQYISRPMLADQFISSPFWWSSSRFELRTLAGYTALFEMSFLPSRLHGATTQIHNLCCFGRGILIFEC